MQIYRQKKVKDATNSLILSKELLIHQKHVVRIINNRARFDHNNELSKSQKIIKNS